MALEHLTPDGHIWEALGDRRTQHRYIMEWYLDASSCTLYHHAEGVWTKHDATNIGRLRFQVDAHSCDTPTRYTHIVDVCERTKYMEILGKNTIRETPPTTTPHPIEYISGIGDSCRTLPHHIQCLVGNVPNMDAPGEWDEDIPHDIIVAIDSSLVFGVGYHSWVEATDNEQVLVSGGGPDEGEQLPMTSYRSELGGIASGLEVIGTLARSGKIKVQSVKLVCDN
jgi:hypothetical protein